MEESFREMLREEWVVFVIEYSGDVYEVELSFEDGILRSVFIESDKYRVAVTLPKNEEHHHEFLVEPQSMSHLIAELEISRGWIESKLVEDYGMKDKEAKYIADVFINLLVDALLDVVEEMVKEGIVLTVEES